MTFRRKPKTKTMPAWKWAQVTEAACQRQQGWTTYTPTPKGGK